MKKATFYKIVLVILSILFAVSFFEIANLSEYHSDQSWGETTIQESNHSNKIKIVELQQLHEDMAQTENLENIMKFLSGVFFIAVIVVLYIYNKEQTHNKNSLQP
jgi:preprotein translocase subunit SecG